MSKVKLGNGASLESYLRGVSAKTKCSCGGSEVSLILSSLVMAGSNLYHLYNGPRCPHGEPSRAGNVAYIVDNFYEPAIKIKGKAEIQNWVSQLMKGSVALVFFRSNASQGGTALDLYLGNKLWLNSGVADLADEMWVWCLGSPLKSLKKHHNNHSHSYKKHRPIHVF